MFEMIALSLLDEVSFAPSMPREQAVEETMFAVCFDTITGIVRAVYDWKGPWADWLAMYWKLWPEEYARKLLDSPGKVQLVGEESYTTHSLSKEDGTAVVAAVTSRMRRGRLTQTLMALSKTCRSARTGVHESLRVKGLLYRTGVID